MIPKKKKTAEEIAALRDQLGIPEEAPPPPNLAPLPPMAAQPAARAEKPVAPEPTPLPRPAPIKSTPPEPAPTPAVEPDLPVESPRDPELLEPVVHLKIPPAPVETSDREAPPAHSLRKHELPLAPAPPVTHKTTLPGSRRDSHGLAEVRKREALTQLSQPGVNPADHLRKLTAHPVLLVPAYLLALGAAAVIFRNVHYFTPLALLALAGCFALFIFLKKPRSRHHAGFIFIIIFLTLVFGGIHYAPLFQTHGP